MFLKLKKRKQEKRRKLQQTARKLVAHTNPRSFVMEQFRTLRTNINFSSPDSDIRSIVVILAAPEEGKKVLLIDGDMRKPTHHTFYMDNVIGLSNVLTRQPLLKKRCARQKSNAWTF